MRRSPLFQLGQEYLKIHPQEASVELLSEMINDEALSGPERIAADFESGDTVVLSGWILSRTEARILARDWSMDRDSRIRKRRGSPSLVSTLIRRVWSLRP